MNPKCKLTGEDGNIFNLLGKASRTLKQIGMRDKASEMAERVCKANSYNEALTIIAEYVEIS